MSLKETIIIETMQDIKILIQYLISITIILLIFPSVWRVKRTKQKQQQQKKELWFANNKILKAVTQCQSVNYFLTLSERNFVFCHLELFCCFLPSFFFRSAWDPELIVSVLKKENYIFVTIIYKIKIKK